jgi:molybdopterin molybdotransferase
VIEFGKAIEAVFRLSRPLGEEMVPLGDACGRTLTRQVLATLDLPRFDAAAMDGWGVRRGDSFPARLHPLGTLPAGRITSIPVGQGETWKVMTGASVPTGADSIVPVEEAVETDEGVLISECPAPGAHIRHRGEIFRKGDVVLDRGRALTPSDLALAASSGAVNLPVNRRPRAGLLVTGEELVSIGEEPGPGQIPNSNGPLLAAALERSGARVVDLGVAPDDPNVLAARIQEGRALGIDLLVTTGGVSAGDFDLVGAVLKDLGAEIVFHKVAIRPAKPLLFARLGELLVFGLPGNPVSAAIAFDFFVRASLRGLSGCLRPLPDPIRAALLAPVRNKGERLALLPGRLQFSGGAVAIEPVATRGSHDIPSHALSDATFLLPARTSLRAGETVLVYPATQQTTI